MPPRVVSAYTRAAGRFGEGATVARAVADRAIDRLRVDGSFVDGPRSGAGLLDRPSARSTATWRWRPRCSIWRR